LKWLLETRTVFRRVSARKARLGAALWLQCFQLFIGEQARARRLHHALQYAQEYHQRPGRGALRANFRCCKWGRAHGLFSAARADERVFHAAGLVDFLRCDSAAQIFPDRARRHTVALVLLAISGLGVLVVGIAPEDLYPTPHMFGAGMGHALLTRHKAGTIVQRETVE